MRFTLLSCVLFTIGASSISAQTLDTFEAYSIGAGFGTRTNSYSIDDTTITGTGQGPNLVEDGCTYSSQGILQWNGDTYFGLNTKSLSSQSNTLEMVYDNPVQSLSFTMSAFDGYSDSATVELYDVAGLLISITQINVPDSTPVPFTYSSGSVAVASVEIIGALNAWTPCIDDHEYVAAGLHYTITGLAGGGTATFSISGAAPSTVCRIGYSLAGAGPINTAYGIVDMTPPISQLPTISTDANGDASLTLTIPIAASGRTIYTQALTGSDLTNSLIRIVL